MPFDDSIFSGWDFGDDDRVDEAPVTGGTSAFSGWDFGGEQEAAQLEDEDDFIKESLEQKPEEIVAPETKEDKVVASGGLFDLTESDLEDKPYEEDVFGKKARDVAISGVKGVVGLGESAVGIADILTKGYAGKGLQAIGYDPKVTHAFLAEFYTEGQKEAFKNVEEAEGFLGTIEALAQNPSVIGHRLVETLPQMAGGGVIGGTMKGIKGGAMVGAAVGEGLLGAGSSAEQIRQQTKSGTLTLGQTAKAIGSGLGTTAFSLVGGRLAKKMGLEDIDTFFAGGRNKLVGGSVQGVGKVKSAAQVAARMAGGGISEGVFEELPQSIQETIWMNAALGKDLWEGVPESAAEGLVVGFVPGAGLQMRGAPKAAPTQAEAEKTLEAVGIPAREKTEAEKQQAIWREEGQKLADKEKLADNLQMMEREKAKRKAEKEAPLRAAAGVTEVEMVDAPTTEKIDPTKPLTEQVGFGTADPSLAEPVADRPRVPEISPELEANVARMEEEKALRREEAEAPTREAVGTTEPGMVPAPTTERIDVTKPLTEQVGFGTAKPTVVEPAAVDRPIPGRTPSPELARNLQRMEEAKAKQRGEIVEEQRILEPSQAPEAKAEVVTPTVQEEVSEKTLEITPDQAVKAEQDAVQNDFDVKSSKTTKMAPSEFLNLTTRSQRTIDVLKKTEFKGDYRGDEEVDTGAEFSRKEFEKSPAPYVVVNADGKIIGHEGRHRAIAAEEAGITDYPVQVIYTSDAQPNEIQAQYKDEVKDLTQGVVPSKTPEVVADEPVTETKAIVPEKAKEPVTAKLDTQIEKQKAKVQKSDYAEKEVAKLTKLLNQRDVKKGRTHEHKPTGKIIEPTEGGFTTEGVDKTFKTVAEARRFLTKEANAAKKVQADIKARGKALRAEKAEAARKAKPTKKAAPAEVTELEDFADEQTYQDQAKWEPTAKKEGGYKGAPEHVKTRKDLNKVRSDLRKLAKEGIVGRQWYENSAKAVLKIVGGKKADAEKFLQLVAIYSPQANVDVNFGFAVRAWNQFKNGVSAKDFKVKMEDQDQKAVGVLYNNRPFGGRKTDSFYLNLMHDIVDGDPSGLQLDAETAANIANPVTVDMWMYRALGFKRDAYGTGKKQEKAREDQYAFTENSIKRLTAELNTKRKKGEPEWKPFQVQAVVWTAMKARYEDPSTKDKTWNASLRQGLATLNSKKQRQAPTDAKRKIAHNQIWRDKAMKLTSKQTTQNAEAWAADFSTYINKYTEIVTWEARPSTALGLEVFNASAGVQEMLASEATDLIVNEEGVDMLAEMLGVPLAHVDRGAGAYAGEVTPNRLSHLIPTKEAGAFSRGEVNAYAKAIQYIFKQDAVPWFRADPRMADTVEGLKATKYKTVRKNGKTARVYGTLEEAQAAAEKNPELTVHGMSDVSTGINLTFTEDLDSEAETKILGLLQEQIGSAATAGFTRTAPNVLTVVNFSEENNVPAISDGSFFKAIEAFADKYGKDFGVKDASTVYTEGEYGYYANWLESQEGILDQEGIKDRPDLQRWIRDKQASFERVLERYTGEELKLREKEAKQLGLSDERVGGERDVSGDESYKLVHWSTKEGLTEIDPELHGTGIKGAETGRKVADPENWVQRSYHGVEGGGYSKEPGLGMHRYESDVASKDIYDFRKDPDGLAPKAKEIGKEDPFADTINIYEKLIKEAGYKGYFTDAMGRVVALFGKVIPKTAYRQAEQRVTLDDVQVTAEEQVMIDRNLAITTKKAEFTGDEVSSLTLQEGTAQDIILSISKESKNKAAKALSYILMKTIPKSTLDGIMVKPALRADHGISALGEFDIPTNTIFYQPGAPLRTIVHELIHGVTALQLNSLPKDHPLRKRMDTAFSKFIKHVQDKGLLTRPQIMALRGSQSDLKEAMTGLDPDTRRLMYALGSMEEFFSMVLTEPTLRDIARDIKIDKKKKVTLWDKIKKTVSGLLQLDTEYQSALDEVLDMTTLLGKQSVPSTTGLTMYDTMDLFDFEDELAAARATGTDKEGWVKGTATSTKKLLKGIGEVYRKAIRGIDNVLGDISKDLKDKFQGYTSNVMKNTTNRSKEVSGWVDKLNTLSTGARKEYHLALLNYHNEDFRGALDRIHDENPELAAEWAKVESTISEISDEFVEHGIIGKGRKFYFPRKVNEMNELMDAAHKDGSHNLIGEIRAGLGGNPTQAAIREAMTQFLSRGVYPAMLTRPGSSKAKSIWDVSNEMAEFYADPAEVILSHIKDATESIEQRRLVGKSNIGALENRLEELTEKDTLTAKEQLESDKLKVMLGNQGEMLENSIGEWLADTAVAGEILPEQEKIVRDVLMAKFNERAMNKTLAAIKNVATATTLGQITSTIIQVTDFLPSSFHNGLGNTATALFQEKLFTKDDIDVHGYIKDAGDGRKSQKLLETSLLISGFSALDGLLKSTTMQASLNKAKKMSRDAFKAKFEGVFDLPGEVDQLYNDIRAERRTDNVRRFVFNALSEVQPITTSQMPQWYIDNPNGRLAYMLKTYSVKMINNVHNSAQRANREGFAGIKPGKGAAGAAVLSYVLVLAMAGAGADELKDLIMGRETDFSEQVIDNLLKIALFSRFSASQMAKGDFSSVLGDIVMPPMGFIEKPAQDIYNYFATEEPTSKTLTMAPVFGKVTHEWISPQAMKKKLTRKRKKIFAINKKLSEESGGTYEDRAELRKLMQEYNLDSVKVPGAKKIKPSSLKRSIKRRRQKEAAKARAKKSGGSPLASIAEALSPREAVASMLPGNYEKRITAMRKTGMKERAQKAILVGNSAGRLGVEYETATKNLDKFAKMIGQIENDGKLTGKNPKSSASGLYQFVEGSVEPAINRLKRHIGMQPWMEEALAQKDAGSLTKEQQTLMFLADLLEKKGSDPIMKKVMAGDLDAFLQAYLKLHHTAPDSATRKRAEKIILEGSYA